MFAFYAYFRNCVQCFLRFFLLRTNELVMTLVNASLPISVALIVIPLLYTAHRRLSVGRSGMLWVPFLIITSTTVCCIFACCNEQRKPKSRSHWNWHLVTFFTAAADVLDVIFYVVFFRQHYLNATNFFCRCSSCIRSTDVLHFSEQPVLVQPKPAPVVVRVYVALMNLKNDSLQYEQ